MQQFRAAGYDLEFYLDFFVSLSTFHKKAKYDPESFSFEVMQLLTLPIDDMVSHTLHCFHSNKTFMNNLNSHKLISHVNYNAIIGRTYSIPGKRQWKAFNKSHPSAQRRQTLRRALAYWIENKFSFRIVRRSIDRFDCGDEKWRQSFMMIIGKCHRYHSPEI